MTEIQRLARILREHIDMPGHLTPLAVAVKTAATSAGALKDAATALLEAAGPSDSYRVVDVGAKLYIVIVPGYGPLSDPVEHVHLAPEVS